MKQITGEEFVELIKKDPSWCKDLKEPLEVTTSVSLRGSEITHLSPKIMFTGINNNGWAADFYGCKNLKVATGTFLGGVWFLSAGIEKIKKLNIVRSTNLEAANFIGCPIKYVPKKHRKKEFFRFDKEIIKKSIKLDTIKTTIKKIKSESNNIEI